MDTLSICIPARNEEFLGTTIKNILENIEGNTEVIAVLDGYDTPIPEIPQDPRVKVIKLDKSIGQRAATNLACKESTAKYVMKCDAHVAFSKGFDRILMEDMQDDWTILPLMRNLHAFDWVCPDGHKRYQGPAGVCTECKKETHKEIVWIGKEHPQSTAYRFDKDLHFQYHKERQNMAVNKYGVIVGYKLSFDPTFVPIKIVDFLTDFARSHSFACSRNNLWFRQNMTSDTVGFSSINSGGSVGTNEILVIGSKTQVDGIATSPIVTKMINNWNIFTPSFWDFPNNPSIKDTMCECFLPETMESSISAFVNSSDPIPAVGSTINSNVINQLNDVLGGQFIYSENSKCFHNGSVTLIPIHVKDLNETMTIPGSCFMITRQRYLDLDICDDATYGSWGQQGVEVSCKTWLSGGKVITDKRCWYAHMFRTQPGFSFPYPQSGHGQQRARDLTKDIFMHDKWPKAIHKFQWLIDKFSPVPGWEENLTKGILYYTDNQLDEKIAKKCREQLMKVESSTLPIVSVSLKPIQFGENIVLPLERGYLTCAKQILTGLELMDTDIVFFCEHDVLYHPSHFDFTPNSPDYYFYNTNSWMYRIEDGHALYYDHRSLSGMSCYRKTAIEHFKKRVEAIEALIKEAGDTGIVHSRSNPENTIPLREGIHRLGFEPGTHNRPERIDMLGCRDYRSKEPNLDIKHNHNLTKNRWRIDQFRDKSVANSWKETDEVPYWYDYLKKKG